MCYAHVTSWCRAARHDPCRMRVALLGVRGSSPAPGPDYIRYGGNTCCVAVLPGDAVSPALVLDAGTGIRNLDGLLDGGAYQGAIALSHLHWDHVHGLPFSAALNRNDTEVQLLLPAQNDASGRDLLAQQLAPPSFPITPEGLGGSWSFRALDAGTYTVNGLQVTASEVAHKGGRTYGYRVDDGSASVAYLPDHAPAAGLSDQTRAMLDGVDLLLHDGQFLADERSMAVGYGHATIDDAVRVAQEAGIRTLGLFHHSPTRTDSALDELSSWATRRSGVLIAREGATIDVATGEEMAGTTPGS